MDKNNIPIKDMANEDKPREKMLDKGKKALSNSELLAIIIGTGSQNMNVVKLAQKLLADANNSLVELSKKELSELKKADGIGDAKAVSIAAALELGSRMWAETRNSDKSVIKDSHSIYELLASKLNESHELFYAIYLNNRNKLICYKQISSGGLTQTSVDIRMILKNAVECNATVIAVAHNHPSGSVRPSKEDINLTKKIKEACEIMDIKLLDHVIVGEHSSSNGNNYFSFYDNGML
ncbi:MAG: DNA repair protein RadC [Bacteroidales bacterium]|nr:DNA repair protein RadC [Bacteroidales bacterium]